MIQRGLKCGDCDRIYPFPRRNGCAFRYAKAEEVCPACDSSLRPTMHEPTVSAQETFNIWEAHHVARLEQALETVQ